MKTSREDFEKIGLKKKGEHLQLNTNILQIANEYYSSVRPKPILYGNDRPLRALDHNGIGYIEIRSLDINPLLEVGIDKEQIQFLEVFLLYCLLEDSPTILSSELVEIDSNSQLVAHKGREPDLKLVNNGKETSLTDWGDNIFAGIKQCSKLLSTDHQQSVENISLRIKNPDLTPSAIMLNEMQDQEMGFFEYTDQFSRKYQALYKDKTFANNYFHELDEQVISSRNEQLEIESNDVMNFDQFLEDYFANDA